MRQIPSSEVIILWASHEYSSLYGNQIGYTLPYEWQPSTEFSPVPDEPNQKLELLSNY
jgi:hypothetical protein